ncbi:X2-like carbohydrate binding domain-containing protein [Paenibacillus sp. FSL M8-0228]|uniref:X2-like carbohydrate binding domain-containing protein n=1 Tax=Paenibacillus TaxID=44249 RepID=UPI00083DBC8C|nr:X2-like carbohydrate binding domain-containing protein [Paenibacillus polymyxa]MBO3287000.1 xyloglucanase [Paenibacillus polymyxa]ODB54567.1 xyloglucanase [Paenibacillus polymyxa]
MTKAKNRLKIACLALVVAGASWTGMIAPTHAASSDDYSWKSVVTGGGGGFVPGIIFNETEKDLIYARTDIGGAYRWNAANESWIPLTDSVGWEDWNKNGVDALATDPVDPNRVYIATGTYTNSWDKQNGQIMRSTDRGNTWQTTKLPFKVGGNMPGRSMGERLTIDPNRNNILFFGARSGNGLWKSSDFGATWSKVSSFPNPGTYVQDPSNEYTSDIVGLAWITFDKKTGSSSKATQTIYVGVADKKQSVYRSTDGGTTWSAIAGQPTGYLPHHGVLSTDGNLYISYSDGAGPYDGTKGELWKLNTASGQWTNISPIGSSSADNHFGYGGLTVDAQKPGTLMVATLNAWWPDETIYRSTDSGATWSPIWEFDGYPSRKLKYNLDISGAPWLTFNANPAPPEVSPKLGWMIGDLEIDPFNSDHMLYGTGATIYGSKNLTNWDKGGKLDISVAAKGVEETAILDLVSPPTGAPLVSAVGDVSGFRHDDLFKAPAKMLDNPTFTSSESIDYAELNPSFMARVGKADYKKDPNAKSIGISNDGGANWYKANSEPSGTAGGGSIAVAADGNGLLWSTSDKGVFYSKTGGNSWTASTGIPANAKIVSDRVNPNKYYAFASGKIYVSTNGGVSFTPSAVTGLPTAGNADIDAVRGAEGDVWFAGGSEDGGAYGLWHSNDSGATFTKLSNVQEADFVGFGKAAPNRTYAAVFIVGKIDGTRGFYRSDDAGANWARINDDKHQYARVTKIIGDPRVYGRAYLGTNGRGILVVDRVGGDQPSTGQASITPTTATYGVNNNNTDITVKLTLNGNTLEAIKQGSVVLNKGEDYTLSEDTVVLTNKYLSKLPKGETALNFHFSTGNDALFTITVKGDTPSEPGTGEGVLKVQTFNGNVSTTSNTISSKFKITNTGTSSISLADVTLRYYYTINGEKTQNFFTDWSSVGTGNVIASFKTLSNAKPGADSYAIIGFKSAAGSLEPGQSVDLQTRISKEDWSSYTQTDDYSFNPTANSLQDSAKITAYLSGSKQWGIEP